MQPHALSRPITPSSAQPAESAFDPDCFDFTAYLSRRLGVSVDLTNEVLGQWLKAYEPSEQESPDHAASRSTPDAKRPSGFHTRVAGEEEAMGRTGTED